MIKPVTDIKTIERDPLNYIWLKRKRRFYLDAFEGVEGMMYGDGCQSDFTVVFSPDRLQTQYPFYQFQINQTKNLVHPTEDYKNEYFPLTDESVQSKLKPEDLDLIKILLSKFVRNQEDWLISDELS